MARRQLWLAIGMALVALALTIVLVRDARRDTFASASGQEQTWNVWRRDVVGVRASDTGLSVELILDPQGGWGDADAEAVAALLDAMEEARRGRRVDGVREADAGLDDPIALVVALQDGTRVTIDVGVDTAVGGRTYVRRADGVVLAVHGQLRSALEAFRAIP